MMVLDKQNNLKIEKNMMVTTYVQQINYLLNQLYNINEYLKESTIINKILCSISKKFDMFREFIQTNDIF